MWEEGAGEDRLDTGEGEVGMSQQFQTQVAWMHRSPGG